MKYIQLNRLFYYEGCKDFPFLRLVRKCITEHQIASIDESESLF